MSSNPEPTTKSTERLRLKLYHKAIIASVELFKEHPDRVVVTEVFTLLKEALLLTGTVWEEKLYTENVTFKNAFTPAAKFIYFLDCLLRSGLHTKKSILHLINLYIKLLYVLHIDDLIDVPLPQRLQTNHHAH